MDIRKENKMEIRNLKFDLSKKAFSKKVVLITISILTGLSMTSCSLNDNQTLPEIDKNKIETKDTTLEDRKKYYDEIDKMIDKLSEKEKDIYYIGINVEFQNAPPEEDTIMFLRNDNEFKGDLTTNDNFIELSPGIYKVISSNITENNGNLGEIEVLEVGKDLSLTIDYNNKTATVSPHMTK